MNTVKFGGNGEESREKFSQRYKNEINKFICGHADYLEYRNEFGKINENTKTAIVSSLSAVIGSQLGVSGAILSPVIVLSLYLAGKMGVKAYCTGLTFDHFAKHSLLIYSYYDIIQFAKINCIKTED